MIELLVNKVVVYTDRADVFLKYTPDDETKDNPDGNDPDRGCFFRYTKFQERIRTGRKRKGDPDPLTFKRF